MPAADRLPVSHAALHVLFDGEVDVLRLLT